MISLDLKVLSSYKFKNFKETELGIISFYVSLKNKIKTTLLYYKNNDYI